MMKEKEGNEKGCIPSNVSKIEQNRVADKWGIRNLEYYVDAIGRKKKDCESDQELNQNLNAAEEIKESIGKT